ncbi:Ig-like domain-containing protein, partial [uncultured Algibacter sp.]|uniref:Ig-like domain-containing protein n=1 Tax=uncultured Algibacter sp. TaxID=298659 RepID=UPI00321653E4
DVLDVRLLDAVSQKGGTISLSSGTGPGGRNELRYTPPGGFTGSDFFHYTVFDTTGRTDFGAVYIVPSRTITVDLNATTYNYDLGTPLSPVQSGWQAITEKTNGDISWSRSVRSADRGSKSGVN